MNEKIAWPVMTIAALLVVGLAETTRAQTTGQGEPNLPAITTSGEGVVRRAPDRAFVDITVENRARNPRDAQSENAQVMTAVQQKLRAANLPKDAVRTTGYGVEPEFDFTNGRRTLRDYVARNTIEVRLDDLNRVGEIVDLATASGATSIGDMRFDLKDRQAAERQALSEAVTEARAKAEAIAAAAGRQIAQIWRIVEEGVPSPGPRPMERMAMTATGAAQTPISAGDIEVRARVTMVTVLK